ncbi:hypothetical protein DNK48_29895 [Streptomyces malaysiensis subsp. malaysiensis]|nr:hypothetical protein DNK48_29895 [Streptomyces malaysiensis]
MPAWSPEGRRSRPSHRQRNAVGPTATVRHAFGPGRRRAVGRGAYRGRPGGVSVRPRGRIAVRPGCRPSW